MNQKGFLPILIFLGVAVVLVFAGGAYYLGTRYARPPAVTQTKLTPIVNQAGSSQTYIDYGLGFSISYPKDYTIIEMSGASYSGTYGIELAPSSGYGYGIYITVGPGSDVVGQAYTANDPKVIFNKGPFNNGHILTTNNGIQLITLSSGQKMFQTQGFDTEYFKAETEYVTTAKNSIYEIFVSKGNETSPKQDATDKKIYQDIIGSFKIL